MITRKWMVTLAVGGLVLGGMAGFGPASARPEARAAQASPKMPNTPKLVTKATATMLATGEGGVRGTVDFLLGNIDGKVYIQYDLSGLPPGDHAFHIHEYGVWSKDGMAVGAEFGADPEVAGTGRVAGSFGNVKVDASGKAKIGWTPTALKFTGSTSIIGRGLVIHELSEEALKSKPPGDFDGRLAIGGIGVAKEE